MNDVQLSGINFSTVMTRAHIFLKNGLKSLECWFKVSVIWVVLVMYQRIASVEFRAKLECGRAPPCTCDPPSYRLQTEEIPVRICSSKIPQKSPISLVQQQTGVFIVRIRSIFLSTVGRCFGGCPPKKIPKRFCQILKCLIESNPS